MNEQPQEQSPAMYNLPSMHITEGLLKQQIDTTSIIQEIENTLSGRKLEWDTTENIVKWSEPDVELMMLNEQGVKNLMLQLRTRLTIIFQLSYFSEDAIGGLVSSFARNVRESVFEHWDEWEVRGNSDASAITGILVDTVYATLMKAKNGVYLRYLGNVMQTNENVQYSNQPQQQQQTNPSLLAKLFGKK